MKALIVDDNLNFAMHLATALGNDSESLFHVAGVTEDATLDQVQNALETRLSTSAPELVLLNRELALKYMRRSQNPGATLYAACSWKYDPHFLLYSFRSLPDDTAQSVVQLPSAFKNIELPDQSEELKIEACLRFLESSFENIQHGYKEVSATAVDIVRLINGAVKAGRIRSRAQFDELEILLTLSLPDPPARIRSQTDSFIEAVKRLVTLYLRGLPTGFQLNPAQQLNGTRRRKIVVVDDEVDTGGCSPWARTLDIILGDSGTSFETRLPSVVKRDVSVLEGADLVVLDMDYERDLDYEGDRSYGGLDLLTIIKAGLPRTPVLMMSHYDDIGLYEECMSRGAFDYIPKSWSSYGKRRTRQSEKDWFLKWEYRLGAPLRYKAFFDDVELLRKREIVPRVESQRFLQTLRDLEEPTHDTVVTLATFFEHFVVGYLSYCQKLPASGLEDNLQDPLFAVPANDQSLPSILQTIRNNVVHKPSPEDQKYDVSLVMVLLRSFYVGLVDPSRLSDARWLAPFQERFASGLNNADFAADQLLFDDPTGQNPANVALWEQRNERLRDALKSTALENDEFVELARAFLRSLTVMLPSGTVMRRNDPAVIRNYVQVGTRTRHFKRGYELFRSVWWLFEGSNWNTVVRPGRKPNDYQKSLLWMMMMRCWIWYFHQLLRSPNEFLFSSALDKLSLNREQALTGLDRQLVDYFVDRKLEHVVPAYSLMVSLTRINKALDQKTKQLEAQSPTLAMSRQTLEESLKEAEAEYAQALAALQTKTDEVKSIEAKLLRLAQLATRPQHGAYMDLPDQFIGARNKLQTLTAAAEKLGGTVRQLTGELAKVRLTQAQVTKALQNLDDGPAGASPVIDNVEVLTGRVFRQYRRFDLVAKSGLDILDWLQCMQQASDYTQANKCVSELDQALTA